MSVNATPDDDRFQKLANDYIEQTLQTHPEGAGARRSSL